MDTDPLIPVAAVKPAKAPKPKGRPADLLACGLALLAALLGSFATLKFFLGFAANDSHLAGLVSALIFSLSLGIFAIIPPILIARSAFKGWKMGLSRKSALWVIFLSLPWIVLSILVLNQTPLPTYLGWIALSLSGALFLWAAISIILSRQGTLP